MEPAEHDRESLPTTANPPVRDEVGAAAGEGGAGANLSWTKPDSLWFNHYVDAVAAQASALDGLDGKPITDEAIGQIARRTARSLQWTPPWRAPGKLSGAGEGQERALLPVRDGPVGQIGRLAPDSLLPQVGSGQGGDDAAAGWAPSGAWSHAGSPVDGAGPWADGSSAAGPLMAGSPVGTAADDAASGSAPGAPQLVTADQIRRIMPASRQQADILAGPINTALAEQNITNPLEIAAFLGQVAVECNQLQWMEEHLGYRVARILSKFPREFRTKQSAQPFQFQPEKLANRAYAHKIGNGDEASGDGWRFRGRGLIQVTGRANYGDQGFESNPDALLEPMTAARTSIAFWKKQGLSAMTQRLLNSSQYYAVTGRVNAGHVDWAKRYDFYRRAVAVLAPDALKGLTRGGGQAAGGKRRRAR